MPWSSADVIRAVENQGYTKKAGRGRRGTHRVWARAGNPGELHNTVTIILNKKEIAAGTIQSIVRQLGIDETTLRDWLIKKRRAPKSPQRSHTRAKK